MAELTKFTVRDLPMLSKYAGGQRWKGLDENVKTQVITTITDILTSEESTERQRLDAGKLAVNIDRLNLEHEKFYTPKADFDMTQLSDAEVDAMLNELENTENDIIDETKVNLLSEYRNHYNQLYIDNLKELKPLLFDYDPYIALKDPADDIDDPVEYKLNTRNASKTKLVKGLTRGDTPWYGK